MNLRLLILFVGIALNGWAQCPSHVLGIEQTGKLGIKIGDTNASQKVITGTSTDVLKVCQGQPLYVYDLAGNGSLTGYYYEFKSDTFDLRNNEPPGKERISNHTYNTPGIYALILSGATNGGNGGIYACQTVEVKPRPEPEFTMAVCKPGEAIVYIPKSSRNSYDVMVIDWADGGTTSVNQTALPATITHTYTNYPGMKEVTITGQNSDGSCSSNPIGSLLPLPGETNPGVTGPPSITQLVLTGPTTASLQFVGPQGVEQEIFRKEPGGTYVGTGVSSGDNTSSLTLTDLDNTKQYCFVVRAKSLCATPIQSQEICSVPLTVSSANKKNTLKWTAYPSGGGFESYTVTNGGTTIPPITAIGTTTYTDTSVACGTEYCYRVTAKIGSMNSLSQEICVPGNTGTDKPEAVTSSYVSVVDAKVQYDWEIPAGQRARLVQISRADNGGGFSEIEDNITKQPYLDGTAEPASRSYCYQMVYRNQCGNTSEASGSVCTIFLRQSGSALTWTASSPFLEDIDRYVIQVLDGNGNVIFAQDIGLGRQVDLSAIGTSLPPDARFRVEASSVSGQISWSNVVELREVMKVYVPDAFTPNGDNTHDVFQPTVLNVAKMKLTVFDSWGNPIYSSHDFNISTQKLSDGWNGRVNGKDAPQGNYAYRLDVESTSGDSFTKRGVFRLIR